MKCQLSGVVYNIATNVKSISELRLYAKIFSEQFINAVLYDVAIK